MDLIEKIGGTIVGKGKEAADKARELAELAGLKSRVSTCEEVLKKNYEEIGRLYCEKYGEMPHALFEKQCKAVRNAKSGIKELQERIREIKEKDS